MPFYDCNLSKEAMPAQLEFEVEVTGYTDNGHAALSRALMPLKDIGYKTIRLSKVTGQTISVAFNSAAMTAGTDYDLINGINIIIVYANRTSSAVHGNVSKATFVCTR